MKNLKHTVSSILGGLVLAVAAPQLHAAAVTVFADNFDSENGGNGTTNYNSFANFTVSDGSVDLLGGNFADILPGNGLYVDLDGSTSDAGIMTSSLLSLSAGTYDLTYRLAGSQRGDTNTVNVSLAGFTATHTILGAQGFTLFTLSFVTSGTNSSIVFENLGGDNVGALLDDVTLVRRDAPTNGVPDGGATLSLLGGAIGLLGLVRYRLAK